MKGKKKKDESVRVTVVLPKELHKIVERCARILGISVSGFIHTVIVKDIGLPEPKVSNRNWKIKRKGSGK